VPLPDGLFASLPLRVFALNRSSCSSCSVLCRELGRESVLAPACCGGLGITEQSSPRTYADCFELLGQGERSAC
jgi:hypothetical protein